MFLIQSRQKGTNVTTRQEKSFRIYKKTINLLSGFRRQYLVLGDSRVYQIVVEGRVVLTFGIVSCPGNSGF